MSDLHLESVPYPDAFRPARPDFDVLVAAGDIWEGDIPRAFRLLEDLASGKPIMFVMGNHEHWNGVLTEDLPLAKMLAEKHGITLLDGSAMTIAGCRFIGSTLWSDYRLSGVPGELHAETGEQIDIAHDGGSHLITVGDAIALHGQARDKLETLMAQEREGLPLVVVTHHAPHPECVPPEHRGTWGAGNSASDLSALTDSGRAALWIHGHIHTRIDMVRPNGTRILCNPAGPMFSNTAFDDNFVVELTVDDD